MYKNEVFTYTRTRVVRETPVGFGGREFAITFYDLGDHRGWVHDFDPDNCDARRLYGDRATASSALAAAAAGRDGAAATAALSAIAGALNSASGLLDLVAVQVRKAVS